MGIARDILVCASMKCDSDEEMMRRMMLEAKHEGADLVELCVTDEMSDLACLLACRLLPVILSVFFRPNHNCRWLSEESRNQILMRAVKLGIEFIDIDYKACSREFIGKLKRERSRTRIIVSNHVRAGASTRECLGDMIIDMQSTVADVIKLVVDVDSITDVAPIFHMLAHCQVPLIARATGERGLISQLLGPKYGAFIVWGSIGGKSEPGLPSVASVRQVYKLEHVNPDTKIFGVVSNPVSHSKGPRLHNPAFRYTGFNGIYVPLLVDDIKEFFRVYSSDDFTGFSVGLPHKEAALSCCDEVHPLALTIGAVKTIVRRPIDGKLVGYNTDCEACMTAIEDAFRERDVRNGSESQVSPIAGKLFVLVGAGGAGRAIAFGARGRGARVVIFNRDYERAKVLADAVSGEAWPFECLNDFHPEKGMILANASILGMEPNIDQTPISKAALRSYELVFDAVYTPPNTRFLREAREVGAMVVNGLEMFIRQALGQFKMFTGGLAPEDFMRKMVMEQFSCTHV